MNYCFFFLFQAYLHLKNHSDEVEQKILVVVDALLSQQLSTWQPSNQLPSANFKALCRQLTKLNESVSDIWTKETLSRIMLKVRLFKEITFFFILQILIFFRYMKNSSMLWSQKFGPENSKILIIDIPSFYFLSWLFTRKVSFC